MFKKENKTGSSSKTQENLNKLKKKKDGEKGHTCKNEEICLNAQPKSKKSKNAEVPNTCLLKEVTDRENEKEKENKCDRKEKTRREKRDNRWTNGWTKGGHKEVTHACKKDNMKKVIPKERWIVVQKTHESEGNENWVQEEEDQENKKIKRNEGWKKIGKFCWKKRPSKKNKTVFLWEYKDYLKNIFKWE